VCADGTDGGSSPTDVVSQLRASDVSGVGGPVEGLARSVVHVGAQVTRVHVTTTARGEGLGSVDTRSDLIEVCRLYARHGYLEVEPFNAEPYAQHWFTKQLTDPPGTATV